jgi:hypothetical protein
LNEKTQQSIKNWNNRSLVGNVIIGDNQTLDMYSPSKMHLKNELPVVKEKLLSPRVQGSNYFSPTTKRHSLVDRFEKDDPFKTTS